MKVRKCGLVTQLQCIIYRIDDVLQRPYLALTASLVIVVWKRFLRRG